MTALLVAHRYGTLGVADAAGSSAPPSALQAALGDFAARPFAAVAARAGYVTPGARFG